MGIIKKKIYFIFLFFLLLSPSVQCATLTEAQKAEYNTLGSAVTFASDKIVGEYEDNIPDDFDSIQFMKFIKDKIPESYYEKINKYEIKIIPKKSYYLLLIYDPVSKDLILFDYSCTSGVDGPILLNPAKYNAGNVDQYDTCKH